MAQITINVPDAQESRIRDAAAAAWGYTGTDPDGQAETKNQFVRRKLREYLRSAVVGHEANRAAMAAHAAALAAANADLTLS